MAIVFLTSSPTGPLDGARRVVGFDKWNGFADRLKENWKKDAKCLMITASPKAHAGNDEMTEFFRTAMEIDGFSVESLALWDDRNDFSREEVQAMDVIFLGGGHVPTQNAFFREIGLKEKLAGFQGIIIGISAGTMNSASIVYAQPEEPGEGIDPNYQKFFEGLGLSDWQICPHFQMMKDYVLDGLSLYDEITRKDSYGHRFLVLPDGSYLMSKDGVETVYGEAWIYADGEMVKVCGHGEATRLR